MDSKPVMYHIAILVILSIIAVTELFGLINQGFDSILGVILIATVAIIGYFGIFSIIKNKS